MWCFILAQSSDNAVYCRFYFNKKLWEGSRSEFLKVKPKGKTYYIPEHTIKAAVLHVSCHTFVILSWLYHHKWKQSMHFIWCSQLEKAMLKVENAWKVFYRRIVIAFLQFCVKLVHEIGTVKA